MKRKKLTIEGNDGIKDLSPLCQCPDLEELDVNSLPLIKELSFFEMGFIMLRILNINHLKVKGLSPLIRLQNRGAHLSLGPPPSSP